MPIRLATWNILAPEFASPPPDGDDYYAATREHLAWAKRRPKIVAHLRTTQADAVCLQEVSKLHWERSLRPELEQAGFATLFAPRPGTRPDGVALIVPLGGRVLRWTAFSFDDGSEKVALLAELETRGRRWCVASVHLKWTAEGDLPMAQLLQVRDALAAFGAAPMALAGDWNVDPRRHPRGQEAERDGWQIAHPDDGRPTWLADGRAERVDGVLVRGFASVIPAPIPEVAVVPGLPSERWPSDHLPLTVELD